MAIAMYSSYLDQIRLNLSGRPGSIILPIVTVVNCTLWVTYGLLLEQRNWPIVVCNVPGIFLGAIAATTVYLPTRTKVLNLIWYLKKRQA